MDKHSHIRTDFTDFSGPDMDRRLQRNVHFFDGSNQKLLGGLIQNGSVSEQNFYDMLSILLITDTPFDIAERATGHIVTLSPAPLQPGEYEVHCVSSIDVNDEPWVQLVITASSSSRENVFRDSVRARDRKCVFLGVPNRRLTTWSGFIACHIFPLQHESWWNDHNYGSYAANARSGTAPINSPQNGLLLSSTIHTDFDNYLVSVNPDDNYKIVAFGVDNWNIDGRTLDPICRDPTSPHCISDNLLRWHYRQSVLANMRGAGEPVFEHDFPPGTDMVAEIQAGPYGKERFELEFEARLRQVV